MKALDTNVVVRFLVGDDAAMAAKALRVLDDAHETGSPLLVTNLVLLESMWVLGSAYALTRGDILDAFERLLDMPALRFESRGLMLDFVRRARASTFDLADILIALHSRMHNCSTTLTFDKKAARSEMFEEIA